MRVEALDNTRPVTRSRHTNSRRIAAPVQCSIIAAPKRPSGRTVPALWTPLRVAEARLDQRLTTRYHRITASGSSTRRRRNLRHGQQRRSSIDDAFDERRDHFEFAWCGLDDVGRIVHVVAKLP